MITIFAAAALTMAAGQAVADPSPLTGIGFLEACHQSTAFIADNRSNFDAQKAMYCLGVVSGVFDVMKLDNRVVDGNRLCLPDQISLGQLVLIVTRFMDEHPQALSLPAGNIAQFALTATYLCKAK